MRSSIALVVILGTAACGKDAPPAPPPPPGAATIAISTPVPSIGNATANDLGTVTVPHPGSGAVIAVLSGRVAQVCNDRPCPWDFSVGICRDPKPGVTVADACRDGRTFDSSFAWPAGGATDPIVTTVPIAIAATFPVEGAGDTVIHVIGWAPMPSRLEGELTLVYTPSPPLAVRAAGLVKPRGAAIAP